MVVAREKQGGHIYIGLWGVISLLTFLWQLALGTSLFYAFTSLAIFLLSPLVIRLNGGVSSMGSLLFIASYAKLFFVSQWLKILLGQPADTHLQAPEQTVFVLLLGVGVFMLAGTLVQILFRGSNRSPFVSQDPQFLSRLAIVVVGLTFFSIIGRYMAGLSRAGAGEYEEGQGLVILMYMASLMPLAVAALTARCAILSEGRRFIDRWVLLIILLTVFQGIWENVRLIMLAGLVAFGTTYIAYGGIVRLRHVIVMGLVGAVMQVLVFPLIDIQRGIERGLGVTGFLSETLNVASDLLDADSRAQREESLENIYYSWDTRLYYGTPLGFLDRFAPSPLDEAIAYVDDVGTFGSEGFLGQFLYAVPNLLLRLVEIDRPIRGGEVLETQILGTSTNMNYGVFAEIYAYFGPLWFLPINAVVLFFYLLGLRLLYGPGQRSYFVPFGFSTLYFTYCNSDIADIGPQVTIQALMNLLILVGVSMLINQFGSRRLKPRTA